MHENTLFRKICIGTAQFGSKYGITNKIGKTKKIEVRKILNFAKLNKINFFDTAEAYGKSQKILGSSRLINPEIITKIKIGSSKKIELSIKKSIRDLKVKRIYAVLIHNPENLLKKNGKYDFAKLEKFKEKNLIKKIGISEYSVKRLKKLIKKFKIDIVSFPYNPFDQRLVSSGLIKELRKKKIEIHIRSIFLQGLLLVDKKNFPRKLKKWNKILSSFDEISKKKSISKLKLCLDNAFSLSGVSKITLGVQSKSQLQEILSYLTKERIKKRTFNYNYINKLSDPSSWH